MLSPICLLAYAYREQHEERDEEESEEEELISILKELLYLEPNFGSKQFELFHANWEKLQRLLRNGATVDLFKFYHLKGKSGIQIPIDWTTIQPTLNK
jgi:hypothetical protein